ncbi:WxL domain-containing protein [Listeria fleischmannii]|jgi:hypothetical protein|uniref:WxL domain-containing protein n=1 Tax=Listeria fleischmannii TaxID=1069827 RepID=UPI00162685C6|nr:WxL domain-containing protein [Listeria fleischmannii]MBC1417707.1 WxL domain-containing protein [Listeria fleischmannii]
MKKEWIIAGILISFTGVVSNGGNALAVETSSASTTGTVQLITGGEEITPVDPNEPIQPGDGKETGNKGPLSIDYVPNFLFGQVAVGGSTLVLTDQNTNPFVQVSDNRGSGAGWTLKLSASSFKNNEDETKALIGTILTIGQVTPEAVDETNASGLPTGSAQIFGASDTSAKTIMAAAADSGMGSWKGKFKTGTGANSVTLTIPAGNKVGSYTSTLTWSLNNAPE